MKRYGSGVWTWNWRKESLALEKAMAMRIPPFWHCVLQHSRCLFFFIVLFTFSGIAY
jgi:hypothetical protein